MSDSFVRFLRPCTHHTPARVVFTIGTRGADKVDLDSMTDVVAEDAGGTLRICDAYVEILESGGVRVYHGSIGSLISKLEELADLQRLLARAVESQEDDEGS